MKTTVIETERIHDHDYLKMDAERNLYGVHHGETGMERGIFKTKEENRIIREMEFQEHQETKRT